MTTAHKHIWIWLNHHWKCSFCGVSDENYQPSDRERILHTAIDRLQSPVEVPEQVKMIVINSIRENQSLDSLVIDLLIYGREAGRNNWLDVLPEQVNENGEDILLP